MLRWEYDVVFYRVLCITLLGVAVTFSLILTNVFVDVDGLISKRDKDPKAKGQFTSDESNQASSERLATEMFYKDNNYLDENLETYYRTKRASDFNMLHMKNAKMKNLLTNGIASLLEELDEEDHKIETTVATTVNDAKIKEVIKTNGLNSNDVLHLAIHNILFKGIVNHADLSEVYENIHGLVKKFDKENDETGLNAMVNSEETSRESSHSRKTGSNIEEHKLLEEIIKCKELENQLKESHKKPDVRNTREKTTIGNDDNVVIKSVIEIWNADDKFKKSNHSNENVKGLIRLIYNGKSIKVAQLSDYESSPKNKKKIHDVEVKTTELNKNTDDVESIEAKLTQRRSGKTILDNHFDNILKELLKNYSVTSENSVSTESTNTKSKRPKRQISVRYIDDDITTLKPKPLRESIKTDDDDLYIEIETHFDSKGSKDEKKKKFVKNIIKKIQNALHSEIELPIEHKNEHASEYFKRVQDPIVDKQETLVKDLVNPVGTVEKRQLGPISKVLREHENVLNKFGGNWENKNKLPNFLTISKAVNSAEMREIDINYDEVLKNGIPKRLQKPLTGDSNNAIDDDIATKLYSDMGNVTLLLKDIDGTGFSIGFNQYMDEAPDKESLKMFNGLEDIIKEYHHSYDRDDASEFEIKKSDNLVQSIHEVAKRDVRTHRRLLLPTVDMQNNYLTSNTMHRQNGNHHRIAKENLTENLYKNQDWTYTKPYSNYYGLNKPIIIKEKILKKTFIPTEMFSLANIINRNKRSLNVQKITNLKSKIKLNRYINTNPMAKKKVFLKNKRNKRHVDTIRIVTRDQSGRRLPLFNNSDEDIFFISHEDMYSDRASIIKESETQDVVFDTKNNDGIYKSMPFEDIYSIQVPQVQTFYSGSMYHDKSKPSKLMSKYPHVFVDRLPRTYYSENSDESLDVENNYRIQATSTNPTFDNPRIEITTQTVNTPELTNEQSVEEIVNAIMPHIPKSRYKLSLKISPKTNTTNKINTGFKEVHTSVNKSFAKDGIQYVSLVNVSEISRIEKLNQSSEEVTTQTIIPETRAPERDNHVKILLKLHKKKIDQQLNSLISESQHLDNMLSAFHNKDMNRTFNSIKTDATGLDSKSDKNNLDKILSSISKLQETFDKKTSSIVESTTKVNFKTKKKEDEEKQQIIKTIKRNENITSEILKKIDKNTNMMELFLQKLSKKLESVQNVIPTEKNITNKQVTQELPKDTRRYQIINDQFYKPNINDTNFINPYHPNIPLLNKQVPVASVLYHGQLYSNALDKIDPNQLRNILSNDRRKPNETKFFIDEIEKKTI